MPDLSTLSGPRRPASPARLRSTTWRPAEQPAINRIHSNIGKAIEAYERRLASPSFEPSPFDRMLAGDETDASDGHEDDHGSRQAESHTDRGKLGGASRQAFIDPLSRGTSISPSAS